MVNCNIAIHQLSDLLNCNGALAQSNDKVLRTIGHDLEAGSVVVVEKWPRDVGSIPIERVW
jgi:hypothetical protein